MRDDGVARRSRIRRWAQLLVAVPVAFFLFPGLFARQGPKLGPFPFFLWYQFAAALLAALLIGVVYVVRDRSGER